MTPPAVKSSASPALNRIVLVLLSAWLGTGLFVWWSAAGTFEVLSAKKNPELARKLAPMPEARREQVLRRAAGEVNGRLFRGWNAAQSAAAIVVLGAGLRRRREAGGLAGVVLPGALLLIVAVHMFWLGPEIEAGGRALDLAEGARAAAARRFAIVHGGYMASDLAKTGLLGWAVGLAARGGGGA